MRPALLTGIMFFAFICITSGQKFTFLPQIGIENNRTTLNYNNTSSFSPLGSEMAPKLSARVEYQFMKRQGVFVGIATNRSVVSFNRPVLVQEYIHLLHPPQISELRLKPVIS